MSMRSIAASITAILTMASVVFTEGQKKDIDITAPDGVSVKGTYFSPGRPGPALLLLHQCNMDRHAWDHLAAGLADAGVHVLAIDFRGYGESGGGKVSYAQALKTVIPEKWPGDVDAAYAALLGQKGVDRARVAVGGASCGVAQAVDLAIRHREIKTLFLLSGPTTEAETTYITETPALAIFGAVSADDKFAVSGITSALKASKNSRSVLKVYPGTEHGVPMFGKNPELEPMVVSWLTKELSKSPSR